MRVGRVIVDPLFDFMPENGENQALKSARRLQSPKAQIVVAFHLLW